MSKLWVKFNTNNATRVSTEGCEIIDVFVDQCKKKLHIPNPPQELSLSTTDGGTPLKPDDSITQITGNTAEKPLFITSITFPHLKTFSRQSYKTMSVEASCRKYLDAIALKLAGYFEFNYRYKGGPNIGDVLTAKENNNWKFRYNSPPD
jgi:hypothetical protein